MVAWGYMGIVEADVTDVDKYLDENQGINHLAIFIFHVCVFSCQLWVYIMMYRKSETMLKDALNYIFFLSINVYLVKTYLCNY